MCLIVKARIYCIVLYLLSIFTLSQSVLSAENFYICMRSELYQFKLFTVKTNSFLASDRNRYLLAQIIAIET